MFMFIVFVLALIALAMSSEVILKSKKHADLGTGGCKFFGYLVGILALIVIVFTIYVFVMHFIQTTGMDPKHMMNLHKLVK